MFSIKIKRAFAKKNQRLYFKSVDDLDPNIKYYISHKLNINSPEHLLIDRAKDEITDRIDFNVWSID